MALLRKVSLNALLPPFFGVVVACLPALGEASEALGADSPAKPALPVDIALIWCPPGSYVAGTARAPEDVVAKLGGHAEWFSDEQPSQVRRIEAGYWISAHEVTRGQWEAVMPGDVWWQKLPSSDSQLPATGLSWKECAAFARQLGRQADLVVRLPNEVEWEYACRAGSDTFFFHGDDVSGLANVANCRAGIGLGVLEPVGRRAPNSWGLYDSLGNAWEWCSDVYSPGADSDLQRLPGWRVVRGGSYLSTPQFARCSYRGALSEDVQLATVGFRIVVEAEGGR